MLLNIDDYKNRQTDPTAPFVPLVVHDELLEAMALSPATSLPASFEPDVLRARATSALRLQQHLIYRIGRQIGILTPQVPKVLEALRIVPMLSSTDAGRMILEAVATAIGIASDTIGAVPIIGWCVKALSIGLSLGVKISTSLLTPGTQIGKTLVEAQSYHTDADASLANTRLMVQAEKRDWTPLFMPSMRGALAAQVRKDKFGRIVIAWGMRDDGKVTRVIIDTRPLTKPYTWHFSEGGGEPFTGTGGLGSVPGTSQIVDVTQCTLLESANVHRGHESLGDPRCGSTRKTVDINVGSWLPITASGAWSLYGYTTKAGASTFTIATQDVLSAWEKYVDEIWEGLERLWWEDAYVSGWGCGPWENALQGLAASHCVGADGIIGGFAAWRPMRTAKKLTSADRDAWEKSNLCTRIVKPAMFELRDMQLALLRKTPMAAYLPQHGMGAFADVSVREEFERSRVQLMTIPSRSAQMLRTDIVDDFYRHRAEKLGLGTTKGDGGISSADYQPPRMAVGKGIVDGMSGAPYGGGSDDGGGGSLLLVGGAAALLYLMLRR